MPSHDELIATLRRTGGIDAAVDFLDSLQRWITGDGRCGCPITNLTVGEAHDPELARVVSASTAHVVGWRGP